MRIRSRYRQLTRVRECLLLVVALRDLHQRDGRKRQDALSFPICDGVSLDRLIDRFEDFGVDVCVEEGLIQRSNSRGLSSRRRR
jgi:hypothetical protein